MKATLVPENTGKTYGHLFIRTCEKILALAEPFAAPGGDKDFRNLLSLKDGIPVRQWRDSNDGLGGGRYPYDVNTALMPTALRAIARLANFGALGDNIQQGMADRLADTWESSTLDFYNIGLYRAGFSAVASLRCKFSPFVVQGLP